MVTYTHLTYAKVLSTDQAMICVPRLREQDADATPNMQLGRARGRRRNHPREHATANVFFTRLASALRAARARRMRYARLEVPYVARGVAEAALL